MSKTAKIRTQDFKKALQLAHLTSSKEKDNILSNALIKISNNKMEITSKNSITKSIQTIDMEESTIEEEIILLNPNTLFNIFKELKEETTELTIKENKISIKNGSFKTTIKIVNQELFPQDQISDQEKITPLEFNKLKHLLKSTTQYPDKNDIAREYTGIFIEILEDSIKTSATDHFRLINVSTNSKNDNQSSFIIENEGAQLLTKIELNDSIELFKTNNSILIKDNEKLIESKLINGTFPDYKSILLDDNSNIITIDRLNILSAIKRVSVTNNNNEIEFLINPKEKVLTVSSKNQEGEESIDTINIIESNSENEMNIKLDLRFAINFLSQITSSELELYYRSNEEPIMMKSKDNEYLYNYIMTPIIE